MGGLCRILSRTETQMVTNQISVDDFFGIVSLFFKYFPLTQVIEILCDLFDILHSNAD